MESLKGQLLIASATLLDPNFRQTVVLVAEHGEEGALGLVLNRPSPTPVAEAVPHLEEIAEFDEPDEAASLVLDDIGFIPADADPQLLGAGTRRSRVFAGYAGWGAGQ